MIAFHLQIFCLPPQQSFAQSDSSVKNLASTDMPDSGAFLQRTMRRPPRSDHSKQIEALLKQMTLEEKVGQMTQLTLGMIVSGSDGHH